MPADQVTRGGISPSTGSPAPNEALLESARAGDPSALERLLLAHHDRLAAYLERKLPASLRGQVEALDLLQETYVQTFQRIRSFEPRGEDAFFRWLCTIARHRLVDAVRARRAAKRGGGRRAVDDIAAQRTVIELVEVLAANQHTPSRSVAGHEAVQAVQVALAGLKEDYREAVRLRHIERLPVADVAARMQRSEQAVHMLLHRGLRHLREALGRTSCYFSTR